jgi:hypothetical protein
MNRHLDDHEIATAVAGLELAGEAARHLADCLSCRRQVAAMEELIGQRRDELVADEPDWQRQQERVLARLPAAAPVVPLRSRRWLRPALSVAAALLVALAVGLLMPSEDPPQQAELEDIEVEEILAEVDAILADESIPGFEVIEFDPCEVLGDC